jgi:hypothetical protein|eukprot:jgi/Chrpa1/2906/Chrysochromulina_OHIO_Genome00010048-RA
MAAVELQHAQRRQRTQQVLQLWPLPARLEAGALLQAKRVEEWLLSEKFQTREADLGHRKQAKLGQRALRE